MRKKFQYFNNYLSILLLTYFILDTTSKPIVCRSTSSSVRAWLSERDRNAALNLSARILVNALMGSSIAGRTP